MKIQKVNANVEYFSKTHANTGGKFFNAKDAKDVYDSARIWFNIWFYLIKDFESIKDFICIFFSIINENDFLNFKLL